LISMLSSGELPGKPGDEADERIGTVGSLLIVLHIGNELLVYGRKPADNGLPGFPRHSCYVLVIIDEAGGVPKSIFDAVDALATNIDASCSISAIPMRSGRSSVILSRAKLGSSIELIVRSLVDHRMSMVSTRRRR
jgi:hypothetical protein